MPGPGGRASVTDLLPARTRAAWVEAVPLERHARRDAYARLASPRDLHVNVAKPALWTRPDTAVTRLFRAIDGNVLLPWTLRCNQDCRYCMNGGSLPGCPDPPEDDLVGMAAAAVRAGLDNVLVIGGEPTTRPGLPSFVSRLRAAGVRTIALGTNAVALDRDGEVERLVEAGVGQFSVSLDSVDPVVQGDLTGNPRNLERVDRALRAMARLPVGVCVMTVLCQPTAPGIPAVIDYLAGLGGHEAVFLMNLSALKPIGSAARHDDLRMSYAEMRPFVDAARAQAAGLGLTMMEFSLPVCAVPGDPADRWEFNVEDAVLNLDLGIVFADPHFAASHRRVPACASCALAAECPGIYDRYLEVHGDAEFRPVAPARG